jgi:hypothetical protein
VATDADLIAVAMHLLQIVVAKLLLLIAVQIRAAILAAASCSMAEFVADFRACALESVACSLVADAASQLLAADVVAKVKF